MAAGLREPERPPRHGHPRADRVFAEIPDLALMRRLRLLLHALVTIRLLALEPAFSTVACNLATSGCAMAPGNSNGAPDAFLQECGMLHLDNQDVTFTLELSSYRYLAIAVLNLRSPSRAECCSDAAQAWVCCVRLHSRGSRC